jgi:glucosamine--fructose-6-phosphate aminotransferase (isomerizing)
VDDNHSFYQSILQQPQALRTLAAGPLDVAAIGSAANSRAGSPTTLIFAGMGASYHAAAIAVHTLHVAGRPALCLEATDLLFYDRALLTPGMTLVFVSQSGASAEVQPILDQLPPDVKLVAVTNEPHSPLALRAGVVLPLRAGTERWVATKTYTNALALLWLLSRQLTGTLDGSEPDTLRRLAGDLEQRLAGADGIASHWVEVLDGAPNLVFLGHGPQAVTARQAAMMANEWAKLPASAYSAGAFRHGFIEQVRRGSGVVLFASPGPAYESTLRLAGELAGYGARVLIVDCGHTRTPDEPRAVIPAAGAPGADAAHPCLTAIMDVLPAQLFAEAMARHLGIEHGFRYIAKVLTKL